MVARYVVLAGSICLAIAACSPKENIATEETLTEKTRPQTAYREIDVQELLINISDLEDVIIILAQQRTRENGAIEQRAYYEQRNYIEIKRLPESGNLFPRSVIDGESGFDSMSRRLRKDFGVLMISHTNPPSDTHLRTRSSWRLAGPGDGWTALATLRLCTNWPAE